MIPEAGKFNDTFKLKQRIPKNGGVEGMWEL